MRSLTTAITCEKQSTEDGKTIQNSQFKGNFRTLILPLAAAMSVCEDGVPGIWKL